MTSLFFILLFVFGTLLGSFASVIIHRLKSGEAGIWTGRSHCKTCERNLSAFELVPVFSWIFQGGKCKGCTKTISCIYPILEITTGLLFIAIGYFLTDVSLIQAGNIFEIFKLVFLLWIGFLTIIYVFYDILFLEIPESVLLLANISVILVLLIQSYFPDFQIFQTITGNNVGSIELITAALFSVSIIGALYVIMLKGMKEIHDVAIIIACIFGVIAWKYVFDIPFSSIPLLSGTIGALGVFVFFFLQILVSKGAWMGGGDLRIAILLGLSLGISFSFAGTMMSYFIGSILSIGLILITKVKGGWKKNFNTQVPFGPFLASGYFATLFFLPQIQSFINYYL